MSIAELPPPAEPEFDRTPPNDIAAEQSVLGAMLLSKDAIADVVETMRASDFYRPSHQAIYDTILDLYGRGEPADAVTVAAELTRVGEIGRIGGAPYLHTLVSMVPTAANASYYARIVREQAILRKLVEAGTRIVHMGYSATGEVDDLVDRAQAEVYEVTERRAAEDYVPLSDIMGDALNEIEAISNRGGEMVGVPTGFSELDKLTNGLHPGQMIIVAARPAIGKALALDTPIPTPNGWSTQGDLRPGDWVLGDDGRPTRVRAISEIWHDRPCYRVEFSDGSSIVADAAHEWLTHTRASRRAADRTSPSAAPRIRTTEQIRLTLNCETADNRRNHSIPTAGALQLPKASLPIRPYVLGVWLGDGTSAAAHFTSADPEIAMFVDAEMQAVQGNDESVQALLRREGLLNNKHIPARYLRASVTQRRELLAGLLDTDGTVTSTGSIQFTSTSQRLAQDVYELVASLGHRVSMSSKAVAGRTEASSIAYNVNFSTRERVFRLERKHLLHKERTAGKSEAALRTRFVTAVEPVASVPVRCIEVENDSHLYLAGRAMVPTHNSTLGLDICRAASIKHGLTSAIFSLEMSRNEIVMRLLSAEAQVPLHHMRAGTMSDADWTKLAAKMGTVSEAPLFIDDSPNMTLMEIRAKCRRLKQRHDLRLVVVDYMQLMTSGKRVESRQQEVSEFSRSLKLLAKELEVPVIAISQLNRGPEQRTDKKPMLSDLRESGSLEQDADMVLLLHREDFYERESARAGEADFIVAKHRNGPTATVTVAFQGHYSRFVDMAQG